MTTATVVGNPAAGTVNPEVVAAMAHQNIAGSFEQEVPQHYAPPVQEAVKEPAKESALVKALREKVRDYREYRHQTTYLGTIELSWDDWAAMPDHPIQRDTIKHASDLAKSGVLQAPLASHDDVAAVLVGDLASLLSAFSVAGKGILTGATKLDGHSRTRAQSEGFAPKPPKVRVRLYGAESQAASNMLYAACDSSLSVKTKANHGQSALKAAGIAVSSVVFKQASSVLRATSMAESIVFRGDTTVLKPKKGLREASTVEAALEESVPGLAQVLTFEDAIRALDAIEPLPAVMPVKAPAIAAYLALLHHDLPSATRFLSELRAGKGECVHGQMDALFLARDASNIAERRKQKGAMKDASIAHLIITAYLGYEGFETFDSISIKAQGDGAARLFGHKASKKNK